MAYLNSGSRIDDQVDIALGALGLILSGASGRTVPSHMLRAWRAQIAALEHRLSHSSMPLAEEKKTLEDIKKLKASRATSAAYDDRLEKLASDEKLWNNIKEKMGQCDVVLDSITKKQASCVPRALSRSCECPPTDGPRLAAHTLLDIIVFCCTVTGCCAWRAEGGQRQGERALQRPARPLQGADRVQVQPPAVETT